MSKVLEGYELWLEDLKVKRPSYYKRMKAYLREFDSRFWF